VIRIIGVWHAFQLEGYYCSDWNHWINAEYGLTGPDVWKPFYEYLSVEAERIDADLLAEEMNEEELALYADHGGKGFRRTPSGAGATAQAPIHQSRPQR
jgi:hypothetical protein